MRSLLALVTSVLLLPEAFANCATAVSAAGGTGLSAVVSNADRRALESLLGGQVDDVACAFMQGPLRFGLRERGFFVLTQDEVLFVRDRKMLEVRFRSTFAGIRRLGANAFGFHSMPPGFDQPLQLGLELVPGGELASFTLTCAGGAARLVSELERRWTAATGFRAARPPGAPASPC